MIDRNQLITKVFNETRKDLVPFFFRYVKNRQEAEDMVQDLFLKILSQDVVLMESAARYYIFYVAKNMAIDVVRHKQFVTRAMEAYGKHREGERFWEENETMECKQLAEMEQRELQKLSPKQRRVYALSRFEDKTAEEISLLTNACQRTVEYQLYIARKKVRSGLMMAM